MGNYPECLDNNGKNEWAWYAKNNNDPRTLPGDFQKLSAWFDAANRAREQLHVPALRHDLALAGLLLEWRSMTRDSEGTRTRR